MRKPIKKPIRITLIVLCSLIAATGVLILAVLLFAGIKDGTGPFDTFYVNEIAKRDKDERKGGIVFYGASNFTRWKDINDDLAPYHIINHGFGGSTDKRLVKHAETLLFPFAPSIIFFQTGSNDYVVMSGKDSEKVQRAFEYKKSMFEAFHDRLPNAEFVVMSGLLLPGRKEYLAMTQEINQLLSDYCDTKEYMRFIDASDMTYDGENFNETLFVEDGIHLPRDGQRLWAGYILPVLSELAK